VKALRLSQRSNSWDDSFWFQNDSVCSFQQELQTLPWLLRPYGLLSSWAGVLMVWGRGANLSVWVSAIAIRRSSGGRGSTNQSWSIDAGADRLQNGKSFRE
jgi:hypothetical protein